MAASGLYAGGDRIDEIDIQVARAVVCTDVGLGLEMAIPLTTSWLVST